MPIKSLYLKNAAPSGATTSLSLQDGGTAPTGALTATGWTVARLTSPNLSAMLAGTKRASTTFTTTDAIPTFAASACFRTENPLNGSFANTNWSLVFRIRASVVSAQTGAIKVRVWRSANADGSGATQLTSAVLTGTTTPVLSTTVSNSSTVTWTPGGIITLANEYLWVQAEWSIVVASGSNTGDAVVYVESAGVITTPNYTATPQVLTATALAITLTPRTATGRYDRDLVLTVGDIDLVSQNVATRVARRLGATAAPLDLNEQTAGLRAARRAAAAAGAIAITGAGADLTVTEGAPSATHYTLTAQAGAFTLTAQAAVLTFAEGEPIHDYLLDADPGMLELAGELAALSVVRGAPAMFAEQLTMGIPRVRLHAW